MSWNIFDAVGVVLDALDFFGKFVVSELGN
jgi:hypothetical protein